MPTPLTESTEVAAVPRIEVHLRHFLPGDEASFKRLNEEWIERHFRLEDKDRAVLGDPKKYILNVGGSILLATIGEEVVGCCALIPVETGVYEVAKMAVTAAHQGQGIGRRILEAVIAEGRRLGAAKLYLETNSGLPGATHLYEALGFQHLPKERLKPSLYARADVFMELWLDKTAEGLDAH